MIFVPWQVEQPSPGAVWGLRSSRLFSVQPEVRMRMARARMIHKNPAAIVKESAGCVRERST